MAFMYSVPEVNNAWPVPVVCVGPTLNTGVKGAVDDGATAGDDEDTRSDDTEEAVEEVAEEITLPIGKPTRVEDEELELTIVLDTVLDEVLNEVIDAPPGAARPPGNDCEDETEVLLDVGVASTEMIGVDPSGVGRLASRVMVMTIVTVSIAVSVKMRYLVTRFSR
jgi:hypothetical protein